MTSPREMSISSSRVMVTELAGGGLVEVSVHGVNGPDRAFASRGRHGLDAVAGLDGAAGDLAGKAAEVEFGRLTPCTGMRKG
ncbi:MAG: hypothetical protein R3D03_04645 [Geminicoccaceae bacterium]